MVHIYDCVVHYTFSTLRFFLLLLLFCSTVVDDDPSCCAFVKDRISSSWAFRACTYKRWKRRVNRKIVQNIVRLKFKKFFVEFRIMF